MHTAGAWNSGAAAFADSGGWGVPPGRPLSGGSVHARATPCTSFSPKFPTTTAKGPRATILVQAGPLFLQSPAGTMQRRAPISMGPCRLNSGALHALAAGLNCPLAASRGSPAASCLGGASPMPQVRVGRAAVSAFPRNKENLDLWSTHKLPE